MKKRILILTDWFLPGYKAGGPIQSLANFTHSFSDNYEISIVTTNLDLNETSPYPNIPANQWVNLYNSRVFYFSKDELSYHNLKKLLLAESYDYFYLNSMYSVFFTLFPLWILYGKTQQGKIVLAPRGMLMQGAMKVAYTKKRSFLTLFRWLGIHKQIIWQATDEQEKKDILFWFGEQVQIEQVQNLPKSVRKSLPTHHKQAGTVHFIFASRVSVKKQLHFFLERLKAIKGNVVLDVFGVVEDENYLAHCQSFIEQLPPNMKVSFKGAVSQAELGQAYDKYDFSILPTLGENFGHAIFDGLAAGKPVLISDKTPWLQLAEKEIGWDISLENAPKWEQIIRNCVEMDNETYQKWSKNAHQFALNFAQQPSLMQKYRILFS
ncbi:MAG: glycosyltransferase [Bacteroidia bacterium]